MFTKGYEGQIRKVYSAGYLGSCFTSRQNRYFLGRWKRSRKKRLLPAGYHFKNYKRRTIRKVMGGGGWGRKIFEPQEFFFRYQIPCMNVFWYFLGLIGGHDTGKLKRNYTHTRVILNQKVLSSLSYSGFIRVRMRYSSTWVCSVIGASSFIVVLL